MNRPTLAALVTLTAIAALGWPRTASAMTLVVRDDRALVEAAELVLHATVADSQPALQHNGRVRTRVRLLVHEVWKGAWTAPELTLEELGGITDQAFDWVPGVPAYRPGQEIVVFVARRGDGSWETLDAWAGRFHLLVTAAGRPLLARGEGEPGLLLYGPRFAPFVDRARDFARFRDWVRAVGGGGIPVADYWLPAGRLADEGGLVVKPSEDAADAKWQILGYPDLYRWQKFDTGTAQPWYYGNDPQIGFVAGQTSGDGPAEFARMIATWDNDPGSTVLMSNAGRHTPYGTGLAGSTDGYSEVLFNDPHNEIAGTFDCASGGVLGRGGVHGVSSTHSFRGHTWYTVVEGDVVFQNWTQDCSWLDSEDLTETIQHEVGHTLGLGHSYEQGQAHNALTDDALMRYLAHGGALADRLGEDDRCAVYFFYPEARVDTQLSPNSSAAASPATVMTGGVTGITVTLNDGSGPVAGQIVRGWVQTGSGSATGTLARGNAYPDQAFLDNGNGTYTAQLTAGSGTGTLSVHFRVNCCDDGIPAPPYACDAFSPTATVTVLSPEIFADGFESGGTGAWSTTVP